MTSPNERAIIEAAVAEIAEMSPKPTRGKWLEALTVQTAPFIKEWEVESAWLWTDWPDREKRFPDSTNLDVGIDAVAVRRDGRHIAIQCKARQFDDTRRADAIGSGEISKFASPASNKFWDENWIVTNGDGGLASGAAQATSIRGKALKLVNITADLESERASWTSQDDTCAHCDNPDAPDAVQTKSCMQREAIAESVRILREHAGSDSGGIPRGEARGRIILPCGTGKTRISLRIVEELTPPGAVSVVLCPSIALVAQIRREYLQNAAVPMDVLAVCSDQTAGYDPKKESGRNATLDPTVDNSNVSANEVKGRVTTDPAEIADWMRESAPARAAAAAAVKVLIGTYQSSVRVSEALLSAGVRASVLIADEAHRTAGLKRRNSKSAKASDAEKRVRDFTVCHDRDRFPATYRVYQTATPRVYDGKRVLSNQNWVVRSMDDEETFGVELCRKSYVEAVNNGWLADYRIIALGVNDAAAYGVANALATNTRSEGRRRLTTVDYMRGLAFALAMGGAARGGDDEDVDIRSCIAFMNTVDKSKNMARDLQTDTVREWVKAWLRENRERSDGRAASDYRLEHLDASSNAAARDTAKTRLAGADSNSPRAVLNVGIFGEGTDSPSLSAVAFLEPRKSPIDVVQAVGRAMRTSEGKRMGYIICPILFPPAADPEKWLSASSPEEGWQELGQILLALRAHDQRIEDELAKLLVFYIPKPPPSERVLIAVAGPDGDGVRYAEFEGAPGEAEKAAERMLNGETAAEVGAEGIQESGAPYNGDDGASEPTRMLAARKNADGSIEIRTDSPARDKPKAGEALGKVNIEKSKKRAREIINAGKGGTVVKTGGGKNGGGDAGENGGGDTGENGGVNGGVKPEVGGENGGGKSEGGGENGGVKTETGGENGGVKSETGGETGGVKPETGGNKPAQLPLDESWLEDYRSAIRVNLLTRSGLSGNRVTRDLNILEESVSEAARHLRADDLLPALNRHFGLDRLKTAGGGKRAADGCTVAALLMMNAAMLHQRIANGGWLPGVRDMSRIKNDKDAARTILRQWNVIMRHDFRPVLEPAVDAIEAVEETGRLAGLARALRHVAAEAERIAETYADMGADHAGPLFNRVMGNQASDGAFFTRPVAASLAARLTLDAVGETDWTSPAAWRDLKTVDPACGSGTLLAAVLADMKRRAKDAGANDDALAALQKIAVEETVKGLDINPVSLQLAASQLTAGNSRISYRRMGLHLMPYGPDRYDPAKISSGTLELLGQKAIVSQRTELAFADDSIASQAVWDPTADAELEDAVDAARNARIVIMNPPFTNRVKMGEKFPMDVRKTLKARTDNLERTLVRSDPEMDGFVDKNSIAPLFVGLSDHCLNSADGVLTVIHPTIALSNPSGLSERLMLARRYHIHTVLTCHDPKQINLSQNTNINESVIVMRRHNGPKPPTRFISMDRIPFDDTDADDFHRCLLDCEDGTIANGWGEVSHWPAERIEAGDWTPAVWRSPELADAAARYANDESMTTLAPERFSKSRWARKKWEYAVSSAETPGSLGLIASNKSNGQTRIQGRPDEYWIPADKTRTDKILESASGYLLITGGQASGTGRLVAVADEIQRVSDEGSWVPVTSLTPAEAKALAVFYNSTPGRIQLMRNAGRKLTFPKYNPAAIANVRIPNIKDAHIQKTLADCWERTKGMVVPQFRDGDCEVRRLWDEAVAEAMGWDSGELARHRALLHREPHVRGLGYNQYGDAPAGSG